jgi:hypothetical protein
MAANGAALSPLQKNGATMVTNGSTHVKNGGLVSHTNGSSPNTQNLRTDFFGHDREEVTRILIQGLSDLGYGKAATALADESGYDLEENSVSAFRTAVINGDWTRAEQILFGNEPPDRGGGARIQNGFMQNRHGLELSEDADGRAMLFSLREQKFLELLEERDLGRALMVLRTELTPLNQDVSRLHLLSR